jgi:hypothetical protein
MDRPVPALTFRGAVSNAVGSLTYFEGGAIEHGAKTWRWYGFGCHGRRCCNKFPTGLRTKGYCIRSEGSVYAKVRLRTANRVIELEGSCEHLVMSK